MSNLKLLHYADDSLIDYPSTLARVVYNVTPLNVNYQIRLAMCEVLSSIATQKFELEYYKGGCMKLHSSAGSLDFRVTSDTVKRGIIYDCTAECFSCLSAKIFILDYFHYGFYANGEIIGFVPVHMFLATLSEYAGTLITMSDLYTHTVPCLPEKVTALDIIVTYASFPDETPEAERLRLDLKHALHASLGYLKVREYEVDSVKVDGVSLPIGNDGHLLYELMKGGENDVSRII